MQYAYSQEPLGGEGMSASNWHAYNDPAMLATLPAAALLYRRADVREATTTYVFAPTPGTLFNQMITPANSALLRTAMEKGKLEIAMPPTPELPWLQQSVIPSNAQVFHDPGSRCWTPMPTNPRPTRVNSSATGNKVSTPSTRRAPRPLPAGSAASRSAWATFRFK